MSELVSHKHILIHSKKGSYIHKMSYETLLIGSSALFHFLLTEKEVPYHINVCAKKNSHTFFSCLLCPVSCVDICEWNGITYTEKIWMSCHTQSFFCCVCFLFIKIFLYFYIIILVSFGHLLNIQNFVHPQCFVTPFLHMKIYLILKSH